MTSNSRNASIRALAGGLGALALLVTPAGAQEPSPDAWSFTLSPYVWFSGLGGEVTGPDGSSETFSADFGDVFSTLKFAFAGLAEARRDRFSIVVDTMFLNLQQGVPVPGFGEYSGASARTRSAEISLIGLYTVLDGSAGRIELGGGVRGWWFDTELKLDPGRLPGRSVGSTTSWVDPVLSARGVLRLGENLAITAYGDVGGFGVGSQFTWQAFATLDYRITENLTASAGFRWVHIDYDKGRTDISLDMAGPIIGASLRF